MAKIIEIQEEFVTLGQFLKYVDAISTGGQAKWYLQENTVYVNGEEENRRGRKLYHQTTVEIPHYSNELFIIKQIESE